MTRLALAVFLVCNLFIAVPAQNRRRHRVNGEVRVSKTQPTVYITFVRVGKREPIYNGESNEGVWLRLHNNAHWTLILNSHGAGGYVFARGIEEEIGMFYGIEEVHKQAMSSDAPHLLPVILPSSPFELQTPKTESPAPPKVEEEKCDAPREDWCHVCSTIRLPPGKSLLFSLPRESLCKNLKIYLVYNYDWEKREGYSGMNEEPQHRVYFYRLDIPPKSP